MLLACPDPTQEKQSSAIQYPPTNSTIYHQLSKPWHMRKAACCLLPATKHVQNQTTTKNTNSEFKVHSLDKCHIQKGTSGGFHVRREEQREALNGQRRHSRLLNLVFKYPTAPSEVSRPKPKNAIALHSFPSPLGFPLGKSK